MSAWVWILIAVIVLVVIGIGFKSFVESIFVGVDKITNFALTGKFTQSEEGRHFTQNITKWLGSNN